MGSNWRSVIRSRTIDANVVPISSVISVLLLLMPSMVRSEDWPAWMGPQRDGVYRETGVIDRIPPSGLEVKWRVPIAGGYAGPAVSNRRVFVFDYARESGELFNDPGQRATLQGAERLIALDEKTGKELWRHEYPCAYTISYPAGPRCTPTVDGDRVYILGSQGDFRCLDVNNGALLWSLNFVTDFGAEVPIWGFSSHPLVDGDLVYTLVGGPGQTVVAFNKLTGEVVWKGLSANAGYCPPSIIEAGDTRQLIVFHPEGVTSLNPAKGDEYWSIPITPMYDMSIARPMIDGDLMYASGIRTESVLIEIGDDRPSAEPRWRGERGNSVYTSNATPLFVDGVIYGTDCNEGNLIAVDAQDGTRLWSTFEATQPDEKRFVRHGTAFITRMGDTDLYLLMSETGDLLVARMTREAFKLRGRFHVLEPTGEAFGRSVVWSHPAYANLTAYIRNDEEIVAVDLKQ